MNKPTGDEFEYDLLNSLADDTTDAVSLRIATDNPTWGICRCRMAAVVDNVSRRMRWPADQTQERIVLLNAYPSIGKRLGLASGRAGLNPPARPSAPLPPRDRQTWGKS